MKVVILAAGRGKRLGSLTSEKPKPMILIKGKPLLAYILESLPAAISEIILIRGYKGSVIKDYFGKEYLNRKIIYVDMPVLSGTAMALHSAKPYLADERFLVIQGDDLYEKADLEALLEYPLSFGIYHGIPNRKDYFHIELTADRKIAGFRRVDEGLMKQGINIATGSFVLDLRIFEYEPVKLPSGEYGLPQTVIAMAKDVTVEAVEMPNWKSITYPDDIKKIEGLL